MANQSGTPSRPNLHATLFMDTLIVVIESGRFPSQACASTLYMNPNLRAFALTAFRKCLRRSGDHGKREWGCAWELRSEREELSLAGTAVTFTS